MDDGYLAEIGDDRENTFIHGLITGWSLALYDAV